MADSLPLEQLQLLKQLDLLETDLQFAASGTDWCFKSGQLPPVVKTTQPSTANIEQDFLPLLTQSDYEASKIPFKSSLLQFREHSERINRITEFLRSYEEALNSLFSQLDTLRAELRKLGTNHIVQTQKQLIDLSFALKQALDYYSFLEKNKFQWQPELATRERFEASLQSSLSALSDGLAFFTMNRGYASAGKFRSLYSSSQTKVLAFIRTFFVKLFTKEQTYSSKTTSAQGISAQISSLYPRSKLKLIWHLLAVFPQFKSQWSTLIAQSKRSNDITQEQIASLQARQTQIETFLLCQSNHSLISYLQQHHFQLYEDAVIKFADYSRSTIHQQLLKGLPKSSGDPNTFVVNRLYFSVYMLANEFVYLHLLAQPRSAQSLEAISNIFSRIVTLHSEDLLRSIRMIGKQLKPFAMCHKIGDFRPEFRNWLHNHRQEQYQIYCFGCVTRILGPSDWDSLSVATSSIVESIQSQMEPLCAANLRSLTPTSNTIDLQDQIKQFCRSIPDLQFCPKSAEKYLITSLDVIVRSVRDANNKIQSRYECYAWNIQIFGALESALQHARKFKVLRKSLRLDMSDSKGLIDRVKLLPNERGWLQYAQDLFGIIKTGMPTLNELTLDYGKYVTEHFQELRNQFIKDVVFVYAKNLIQFLQKLAKTQTIQLQSVKELCQASAIQALHQGFLLNLQRFLMESQKLRSQRTTSFNIWDGGDDILRKLMEKVYETMFELLDQFYVQIGKHSDELQNVKSIGQIRKNYCFI